MSTKLDIITYEVPSDYQPREVGLSDMEQQKADMYSSFLRMAGVGVEEFHSEYWIVQSNTINIELEEVTSITYEDNDTRQDRLQKLLSAESAGYSRILSKIIERPQRLLPYAEQEERALYMIDNTRFRVPVGRPSLFSLLPSRDISEISDEVALQSGYVYDVTKRDMYESAAVGNIILITQKT